MFFNATFFVQFALFPVFLVATFQGATILETRSFESPIGRSHWIGGPRRSGSRPRRRALACRPSPGSR